jgi:hypothetical protein
MLTCTVIFVLGCNWPYLAVVKHINKLILFLFLLLLLLLLLYLWTIFMRFLLSVFYEKNVSAVYHPVPPEKSQPSFRV